MQQNANAWSPLSWQVFCMLLLCFVPLFLHYRRDETRLMLQCWICLTYNTLQLTKVKSWKNINVVWNLFLFNHITMPISLVTRQSLSHGLMLATFYCFYLLKYLCRLGMDQLVENNVEMVNVYCGVFVWSVCIGELVFVKLNLILDAIAAMN